MKTKNNGGSRFKYGTNDLRAVGWYTGRSGEWEPMGNAEEVVMGQGPMGGS